MRILDSMAPAEDPGSDTQVRSQVRGARVAASSDKRKDVYIRNAKEVDVSHLQCTETIPNSFLVRLKSDAEGGSKQKRQDHINRVQNLCQSSQYHSDSKGYLFGGIEVRFEKAFDAYAGHFHPAVEAAIRADKVSVTLAMAIKWTDSPTRKWS